ncbi:hypothetical protein ACH4ZU_26295 [Streptomyces sp. NPDC020472]|uniref:hypothetical protein n=1 Tax=Streptomyces sp. NPDC020472 TaxID=3365075 RepID=UPI0037A85B31
MSDASVVVQGNRAEISLPAGAHVRVTAMTNSKYHRQVRLSGVGGSVDGTYSGP